MAILITGGSTGIGRGIALHFARDGNDVFVNYARNDDAAAETAALIEQRGGRAHLVKADLGVEGSAQGLLAEVKEHTDRLDQIVHCAAAAVRGPLLKTDPADIAYALRVNALSLIDVVREAMPLMQRGSCVFMLSSRGGRIVVPEYGPLGIPKALADHIIRYLVLELGPLGMRANMVAPGALDTPAFRAMFPDTYEQRLAAAAAANPSGRGLEFDDVAGVIERVSGPEFAMVQGQYIAVDGGNSL
ncbi:MAG TPA: SDR family oxidoreductase [Solirubrobacteraceae bacterium]|jgi:NAD(P)-dependent dehydrogenase (short-subunit alcohol dehydrogenase family)|nr:SDR family oxidoreductase [Solirubrobacteraceae bacterium]